MTRLSFEKYMGRAVEDEQRPAEADPSSRDPSPLLDGVQDESYDLTISQETLLVARAMDAARIPYSDSLIIKPSNGNPDVAPAENAPDSPFEIKAMLSGWLMPGIEIADVEDQLSPANRPSMLSRDGLVFYYAANPTVTISTYKPELATPTDDELIRYGLARLVARHELELESHTPGS